MTYVVSNLQGCLDEFTRLLETIRFGKSDTMYVLGDILDNGPQPMELLYDLSIRTNVYAIAGDRDFLALNMLKKYENMLKTGERSKDFIDDMTDWISNGGREVMEGYRKLDSDGKEGVIDYLEDMSLYEEVRVKGNTYLLLHMGIYDFTPNLDLEQLEPLDFFSEALDPTAKYFDDKTIIAGHTPTCEDNGGEGRIFHGNGTVFVDCGLTRGGRLGCLCLDNGREYYV